MEILDKSKNECNRGKVEVAFIVKKKKTEECLRLYGHVWSRRYVSSGSNEGCGNETSGAKK